MLAISKMRYYALSIIIPIDIIKMIITTISNEIIMPSLI
jgi:hypothetical protein